MSALAAELAPRMRVADPRPPYCSGCYTAAVEGVEFVDVNAAHEGETVTNPDTGALIHIMDDIYFCFACVRQMCEAANIKPELHASQAREIRRLELAAETWEQRCHELERLVGKSAPEPVHPPRARRGR
jgi:hypothetical protein